MKFENNLKTILKIDENLGIRLIFIKHVFKSK